jgi:hypothetical protein
MWEMGDKAPTMIAWFLGLFGRRRRSRRSLPPAIVLAGC